jgi:hypothetical protein
MLMLGRSQNAYDLRLSTRIGLLSGFARYVGSLQITGSGGMIRATLRLVFLGWQLEKMTAYTRDQRVGRLCRL